MQASIDLGYFPKSFKQMNTVVLRNPGKPDYTVIKAYRPIALENTLGKILESSEGNFKYLLSRTSIWV